MNLGCSNPVENLEFVRTLEKLLNREAKIVDTPTPSSEPLITYADVSKAARLLGYKPKVNVAEGLSHFIEWMRLRTTSDFICKQNPGIAIPGLFQSTLLSIARSLHRR